MQLLKTAYNLIDFDDNIAGKIIFFNLFVQV